MIQVNTANQLLIKSSSKLIAAITSLLLSTSTLACTLDKQHFAMSGNDKRIELHFIDATRVHISNSHNKQLIKANWHCREDAVVIQHPAGNHHFYFSAAMSQRQLGKATTVPALISFCEGDSCPLKEQTYWQQDADNPSTSSQSLNRLTIR